jgi:hypothetical protein
VTKQLPDTEGVLLYVPRENCLEKRLAITNITVFTWTCTTRLTTTPRKDLTSGMKNRFFESKSREVSGNNNVEPSKDSMIKCLIRSKTNYTRFGFDCDIGNANQGQVPCSVLENGDWKPLVSQSSRGLAQLALQLLLERILLLE